MYFSDDSIEYETTASQDERIEHDLQREREEEKNRRELHELGRKENFEDIFNEKKSTAFQLPGLTFLKFTHLKIKFSFTPSKIVHYVSRKVIFYCSLLYYEKYRKWHIKRDSFPVTYKSRIYVIFYSGGYFAIEDNAIIKTVLRIYEQLTLWAQEEDTYRLEKFMRYQEGEDIYLDADDEELFLDEDQKRDLHEKRERIWRRMLPPRGFPY